MTDTMDRIAGQLLLFRTKPGSVYLYPHVGIDGDALGSCLALLLVLRKAGIATRLLMDEPVPYRLAFLPHLDLIEHYDEENLPDMMAGQGMALAVDCSDGTRVGRRQILFDKAPLTAVLDHHVSDGESELLRLIDTTAAATGEIVFDLVRWMENRLETDLLDQPAAMLLMTAIISDTGGFVFSNTSARTFRTAAELMAYSINLRKITYHQFDMTSQPRLRLMGRLFSEARFESGGKLVIALAGRQLMDEIGATDLDLDGVVTHLRNVDGVEAAFLVREMPDGSLRVNIRSGEYFNAAAFAGRFGGGGHPKAAGLQLTGMTLDEAARLISGKAGDLL